MNYSASCSSPVGALTLASDGKSLTGLWILGQKYYAGTVSGEMTERDDLPIFAAVKEWLSRYFSGGNPDASALPLAPSGGAFRQAVWRVLREIPYGQVITYGEAAKKAVSVLGAERASARAAGGAVAHNPISIIIPCHRVVGSGGSLTGYAGGLSAKVCLLELEGAAGRLRG